MNFQISSKTFQAFDKQFFIYIWWQLFIGGFNLLIHSIYYTQRGFILLIRYKHIEYYNKCP